MATSVSLAEAPVPETALVANDDQPDIHCDLTMDLWADLRTMPSDQVLNVLVADDSPIYRKLVEHAFEGKPYRISFAKTGAEAMLLLSQKEFSLVITDWMMPDMNGLELCEQIRSKPQHSYTYIIILTGITEKSKVVKGLAAGADDYLTKPFHSEEFLARVGVGRRIINLHRQIEAHTRQLAELALTDSLTGLPNRRAIEEWAHRQLCGAARHGFSFWVVVADLDWFKCVNDTFGHEAGDTVLRGFAQILKANSRSSEMSARIGGEEFLLTLTHANREGVLSFVERIRKQLESQRFTFGSREISVTASFGVAEYTGHDHQDFPQMVEAADMAMYSAKQQGRNRIEFAPVS